MGKQFNFREFEEMCVVDRCAIDRYISNMVINNHCPEVLCSGFECLGTCYSHIQNSIAKRRLVLIEIELGTDKVFEFLVQLRLHNVRNTKIILVCQRQTVSEMLRIQDFTEVVAYIRKPFSMHTASILENRYI